jgi:hypothetical protein
VTRRRRRIRTICGSRVNSAAASVRKKSRDGLLLLSGQLDRTAGGTLLTGTDGDYVTNDQSADAARYDVPRPLAVPADHPQRDVRPVLDVRLRGCRRPSRVPARDGGARTNRCG